VRSSSRVSPSITHVTRRRSVRSEGRSFQSSGRPLSTRLAGARAVPELPRRFGSLLSRSNAWSSRPSRGPTRRLPGGRWYFFDGSEQRATLRVSTFRWDSVPTRPASGLQLDDLPVVRALDVGLGAAADTFFCCAITPSSAWAAPTLSRERPSPARLARESTAARARNRRTARPCRRRPQPAYS